MLRWRLMLGAVLISLLIALFWLDASQFQGAKPGAWLFPLVLLAAYLGASDLRYLYAARQWQPAVRLLLWGNVLIVASNACSMFWLPGDESAVGIGRWGWPLLTMVLLLLLALLREMYWYQQRGDAVLNLALLCFGWAYVGLLLSMLLQLRVVAPGSMGVLAVASMILFVKLGDTGAYALGRLIGRHKMTPLLSPGKTWEGAGGAILLAMLGAVGVVYWWIPQLTDLTQNINMPQPWMEWLGQIPLLIRWLSYAVLMALVGLAGDLAESLLKRDLGRNDSSNWLPGFGGTLDLLDSLLFAGPVAYFVWLSGWLTA